MVTSGLIYETGGGVCLARLTDSGAVLDATTDGRQVATHDSQGRVYSLQGVLFGYLSPMGGFEGGTPAAFRKLFDR